MFMTAFGCNTQSMVSPMQIEFEKMLLQLGVSYRMYDGDFYAISNQSGSGNPLTVRLISTLPVDKLVHGSKNGIDVQAIGLFKFKLTSSCQEPDIFAYAFSNNFKIQVEFIIIPRNEFLRRHGKLNPKHINSKRTEVEFWLMQDGSLYDTTNISPEGEWYLLSKGVGGRLADRTEMDYTEYFNNWQVLKL